MARISGTAHRVCIFPSKVELFADRSSMKGAIEALESLPALSDDIVVLMNNMLSAAAPALDNPFGALCTIFLIALTKSFRKQSETTDEANIGVWVYALEEAFQELSQYANHRPAMVPTLDALDGFVQKLHSTGDISKAAKAADQSPGTATNAGAQLLCAFLAGLAGPLNGKSEQRSDLDKPSEALGKEREHVPSSQGAEAEIKWSSADARIARERKMERDSGHLDEEDRQECEAEKPDRVSNGSGTAVEDDKESDARDGLRAEVVDQTLREENPLAQSSEGLEKVATSAEEKHREAMDAANNSPGSASPINNEIAKPPGLITSLGAALGLTSRNVLPKEDAAQPPVSIEEGQVTDASRDKIVDALQINHSEFDAAMEGTRSRESLPRPTRRMDETTLLDMVRQQIETLGISSSDEAVAEKGVDEDEYELV
jgi:hypothetical protein